MKQDKKMPTALVKCNIPVETRDFELARWSLLMPDKKREMLYLSIYRNGPTADDRPNFYVASWSARSPFNKLFSMMQVSHQEMAVHYDLPPLRLQYNLRSQLEVKDYAFHDREPKSVDQFLHDIKPPTFARADGVFFGISLDGEIEPRIACFASFYKMPYAVSAIWAASSPCVGEDLNQSYVQDLVGAATENFPSWNSEMYARLSQAMSSPGPSL